MDAQKVEDLVIELVRTNQKILTNQEHTDSSVSTIKSDIKEIKEGYGERIAKLEDRADSMDGGHSPEHGRVTKLERDMEHHHGNSSRMKPWAWVSIAVAIGALLTYLGIDINLGLESLSTNTQIEETK